MFGMWNGAAVATATVSFGAAVTYIYLGRFSENKKAVTQDEKAEDRPNLARQYSDDLQSAYEDTLKNDETKRPQLNPFISETRLLTFSERLKMSMLF